MTRLKVGLVCLVAGVLIGLGLYDGCSEQEVVEKEVTRWRTQTVTKIERQEVKVPEAHTVVKWRDRVVRPQIDTTNGRVDTVLVSEEFAARFEGRDSSNGGSVQGWIRSHPLRVEDILVSCPPDTSIRSSDSVVVEREKIITERPIVALTAGPFVGLDHELRIRYGAALSVGLVFASW